MLCYNADNALEDAYIFFKSMMTAVLFNCLFFGRKVPVYPVMSFICREKNGVIIGQPISRVLSCFIGWWNSCSDNHCILPPIEGNYTAYWEVQQSHLYLHHLEVCVYDKQKKEEYSLTYQPDQLKKCFMYYQAGKICAAGSAELRAGKGSWCVMYTAADRNLETEQVMVLLWSCKLQTYLCTGMAWKYSILRMGNYRHFLGIAFRNTKETHDLLDTNIMQCYWMVVWWIWM